MAALLAGQSINSVAKEYHVPKGTVSGWHNKANRIVAGAWGVATVAADATQKQERIGGVVVDLFIAKLESQIALAEHVKDKRWLSQQDASGVAVLSGVSDDKLMRMLEKFDSARSEPE